MEKALVYLACPYTHPDRPVRVERFEAVNRVAGRMMMQGDHVFSPISHSHPICEAGEAPGDWEFWKQYDYAILQHCSKVVVLRLPGWERSVGVTAEIEHAQELGIPIEYIDP